MNSQFLQNRCDHIMGYFSSGLGSTVDFLSQSDLSDDDSRSLHESDDFCHYRFCPRCGQELKQEHQQ